MTFWRFFFDSYHAAPCNGLIDISAEMALPYGLPTTAWLAQISIRHVKPATKPRDNAITHGALIFIRQRHSR